MRAFCERRKTIEDYSAPAPVMATCFDPGTVPKSPCEVILEPSRGQRYAVFVTRRNLYKNLSSISVVVAVAESVADGSLGDSCQSGGLLDACPLLDEVAGDEFLLLGWEPLDVGYGVVTEGVEEELLEMSVGYCSWNVLAVHHCHFGFAVYHIGEFCECPPLGEGGGLQPCVVGGMEIFVPP